MQIESEVGRGTTITLLFPKADPDPIGERQERQVPPALDGGGMCVLVVIFSDVVMPGMGGIALARRLAEVMPTMPVVLASGYSDVLASEGSGGVELLPKPYSADQLSSVLRRAVARASR